METTELITLLKVTSFLAVFAYGATMAANALPWLKRAFLAMMVVSACASTILAAQPQWALWFVLALILVPAIVAMVCLVIQKLILLRKHAVYGKSGITLKLDIRNAYRLAWGDRNFTK